MKKENSSSEIQILLCGLMIVTLLKNKQTNIIHVRSWVYETDFP